MDATMDPPTRVFWAPGCSSCLRAKEFLRKQGIPFVPVNVAAEPGAMDELRALGARSVPIVARGDRYVYAQTLKDIREFLGLPAEDDGTLAPQVLVERVNIILPAAMRYVRQMPDAVLDGPFRNSWAPPRGLAHHVFRIVEAFLEARGTGEPLTNELIMQGTHEVVPRQDVIGYGERVLARFNAWWAAQDDRACTAVMATYYGDQSVHLALERTTWHSAQHTRQLMVVLDSMGVAIDGPLTAQDLAGLPLPEKAWGDEK